MTNQASKLNLKSGNDDCRLNLELPLLIFKRKNEIIELLRLNIRLFVWIVVGFTYVWMFFISNLNKQIKI
jgi:hypothetical protein